MTKLEIAKEIIKYFYNDADCGIYDTHNTVGDLMFTIYDKDGLGIDICYYYSYFEVFGLSKKEFAALKEFYNTL